ncbi:MAG TPA: 2-oxo-4-hydroxy-4-carboxy-5-ureidoimidazoline decarboxylase [Verrucomicrobiae bacterium]|jgi:OHCU decarboxylase|nr:2-oxo-4-hydroxy-4-carboxy-5-ureidoimidazoline decarboxylase [Verrucomicrobiae bacterium]
MTVAQLNAADRAQFTASIGFVFEDSPWIARAAWDRRPFADVDALLSAMLAVLDAAPARQRLELIDAHPDLAGRVAREGRLTSASRDEQSSAGLDRLTPQELARFEELNGAYRDRFGFPFVICAREQTTATILAALERRASNPRDVEIATALDEIGKIARLRLIGAVAG